MRPVSLLPRALLAASLAAALSQSSRADEKPLWELGLGAGVLIFNDYRGANTMHVYPLPLPYFVYRGDFLKADREGVRGKLFNQNRIELNLSFNATTPVRNDSARAVTSFCSLRKPANRACASATLASRLLDCSLTACQRISATREPSRW